MAGGRILDPRPGGRSSGELADAATGLAAALDQGPDDLATALLIARGIAAVAELQIDSGGGTPGEAVIGGGRAMALPRARVLAERISRQVDEFHAANPLRPGIPKASLASGHRVDPGLLDAVLKRNVDIVDDGATVRSASHGAAWSESDEAEWERAETTLRESGLAAPRSGQLGLRPELLHAAVRHGRLTKVADDLVYLPSQLDEIVARLGNLPEGFSVAEFRDEMEISRRQAVPLLEWLDAGGITSRRGDHRTLRRSQHQ